MPKSIDLTGQHFSFLKVVSRGENTQWGEATWICECKCGKTKKVTGSSLRNGTVKSCGCMRRELSGIKNIRHGMKGKRLYNIWQGMIQRTTNPNNHEYSYYGGRGIEICEEWRNSYETFHEWAIKNGYANNLTIDREDNDRGYCPDNCRWVTTEINCRNKSNNHCLTFCGQTKTITEWAEITGISKATLRYRVVKMGLSAEKALTTSKLRSKKQPYGLLF